MSDIEELTRLARRVEAGVLDAFANKRDAILDLMDEKSVIVGAGSNVFNGRAAYESWPPNPPGILTRNVTFTPLYTNHPNEALVVGTYVMCGPCVNGTVNQHVTINLRREGDDWKISLAHFSNEWPVDKPGASAKRPTGNGAPRRLQLRSENGIIFVDPEEIVYAESSGKRSIVHLKDRNVTASVLLGGALRHAAGPVCAHQPLLCGKRALYPGRGTRRHPVCLGRADSHPRAARQGNPARDCKRRDAKLQLTKPNTCARISSTKPTERSGTWETHRRCPSA